MIDNVTLLHKDGFLLTLTQLSHFVQNAISFSIVTDHECDIFVRNEPDIINI